jgi:hypothetical protein
MGRGGLSAAAPLPIVRHPGRVHMSKTAQQVIEDTLGEYPDKPAEYLAKRIVSELDKYGFRIIRHRVVKDPSAPAPKP